jgi:hypothetical protein
MMIVTITQSIVEMWNTRPKMTLVIAGTTVVLASEVIYWAYWKLFGNGVRDGKRKKVTKRKPQPKSDGVKSVKEVFCSTLTLALSKQRTRTPPSTKEEEASLRLEERKPSALWNTVLFFPDFEPAKPGSSTKQLISYFESARMSIYMCMYLCSHPELGDVIRRKYREGLLIQVVTDYDTYTAHNNCGVKHWINAGIKCLRGRSM